MSGISGFSKALAGLGGFAGMLFGVAVAGENPQIHPGAGFLGGFGLGALAGWAAGEILAVVWQIAIGLLLLAAIAYRGWSFLNFMAGQ